MHLVTIRVHGFFFAQIPFGFVTILPPDASSAYQIHQEMRDHFATIHGHRFHMSHASSSDSM